MKWAILLGLLAVAGAIDYGLDNIADAIREMNEEDEGESHGED